MAIDDTIEKIIKSDKLKKHEKLSRILYYVFVKICKIDQSKYFILGSYALRKYREINDLDMNIFFTEALKLEKAVEMGFGRIEFYHGQVRWFFDMTSDYNKLYDKSAKDFSIEAFFKLEKDGFPNKKFSLSYLSKKKALDTDSKGHLHFSLKTLLKFKKLLNREKDQPDIILLEKILKKN